MSCTRTVLASGTEVSVLAVHGRGGICFFADMNKGIVEGTFLCCAAASSKAKFFGRPKIAAFSSIFVDLWCESAAVATLPANGLLNDFTVRYGPDAVMAVLLTASFTTPLQVVRIFNELFALEAATDAVDFNLLR